MKIKKIIVFSIIAFLFVIADIKALPQTLGPISSPEVNGPLHRMEGVFGTFQKSATIDSKEVAVFCTRHADASPKGQTCSMDKNSWTTAISAGVAAILAESKTSIDVTKITDGSFATILAINQFLYNKNNNLGNNITTNYVGLVDNTTYKAYYDTYMAAAENAYNDALLQPTISLSNNKLTFTLQGDKYVSNTITVTSSNGTVNVTSSVGTLNDLGNNKYTVSVDKKSVVVGTPVSVKLSATATKQINQARNYNCGTYIDTTDYDADSNTEETLNYQTVTPAEYDKETLTAKAEATGEISINTSLTINKVDSNNKHISGAKITVTGDNYKKTFESGNPIEIKNLKFGTYTIEETQTPNGYVTASKQTVTFDENNLTKTITLTNKLNKVIISKTSLSTNKELPGATLEIQDEDGKIVKYCTDILGNPNKDCKWVSTEEDYVIEGMPNGTYYLVEKLAPEGYALSTEKVKFVVDGTKEKVNVKMTNKLKKVIISKISVVDNKELPGATLEVQDKDGKIIKYCTDKEGNKNAECKWVSTEENYVIEGLPNGTYYLVETIAPEGYALNKEKVEFVINDNEAIVEVEMKNELEVKVPDTLSARSSLLIAISMFDIALGIGILTYVKKNKAEE